MATLQRGLMAPLDHHLRPLTRKPKPSSTIDSAMLRASEDATAGSVFGPRQPMGQHQPDDPWYVRERWNLHLTGNLGAARVAEVVTT